MMAPMERAYPITLDYEVTIRRERARKKSKTTTKHGSKMERANHSQWKGQGLKMMSNMTTVMHT